jgi:DNA-binding XRE family transcriptional regulator
VSDGCDRVAVRRVLRVAARLDGTIEARRISTTLGADVRTRRKQLGWSQAELGRRIGLSRPRVSMIERGLGLASRSTSGSRSASPSVSH